MDVIEDVPVRYSRRLFDRYPGDADYAQAFDPGEGRSLSGLVDAVCWIVALALLSGFFWIPRL